MVAVVDDWRVDTATESPLLEAGHLKDMSEQDTRNKPKTKLDPPVFVTVIVSPVEEDVMVACVQIKGLRADIAVNLHVADPVKEDAGNDNVIA
jgi:hypothetical protein